MRRRLDVRKVELRDLADGLENRAQLLLEAGDLLVRQRQPREPRDVQHLIFRNRHVVNPRKCRTQPRRRGRGGTMGSPAIKRAPSRGPLTRFRKGKLQMATTFAACRPFWPCT